MFYDVRMMLWLHKYFIPVTILCRFQASVHQPVTSERQRAIANQPEVDGVRLTLQRDVACCEQLHRILLMARGVRETRLAVLQDCLAIHLVGDGAAAAHDHFCPHPLIAGIGFRAGVQAVRREHLAIDHNVGARSAEVVGGPIAPATEAAQELRLDRIRKLLVQGHGLRRLSMQHDAAVSLGPTCASGHLVADEAVLDQQVVAAQRLAPEKVTKAAIEPIIGIVADLQQPIFHPEGVAEVLANRMAGDLCRPTRQVFTVEEINPIRVPGRRFGAWGLGGGCRQRSPDE